MENNLKKIYDETVESMTIELATEANAIDTAIKDAKRGFVAHLRGGRKVADMVSQVIHTLESGNGKSTHTVDQLSVD